MRAIRARYNPYVQARARVDQLRKLGHSADKVGSSRAEGEYCCAWQAASGQLHVSQGRCCHLTNHWG